MEPDAVKRPLLEWAKSIQNRLNVEYEESKSVLNHPGALGAIREEIVRNILESFLPPLVQIGTGQVIDSAGVLSNQVDIVIAKGAAPAFRFKGAISAFLYETVLATIEVKSMLYQDKLVEALENSRSVTTLMYTLSIRSKGKKIFDDAFSWIDSIGGLVELDRGIQEPNLENALGCPDEIWNIVYFIYYWLHWEKGHFSDKEYFKRLTPFIENPEFDLFVNLLASVLNEKDTFKVLTKEFTKASAIKDEYFDRLYEYLSSDKLIPSTFILAYGGYEKLENLVSEVKNWYDQNHNEVGWYQLPRVILNHKMLMYRTYNEYHCHEFEYPVLFLINAIIQVLMRDFHYPVSYGLATGITQYFDLGKLLGLEHPKHSPTYMVWSIPFDNSTSGEIIPHAQILEAPVVVKSTKKGKKHRH